VVKLSPLGAKSATQFSVRHRASLVLPAAVDASAQGRYVLDLRPPTAPSTHGLTTSWACDRFIFYFDCAVPRRILSCCALVVAGCGLGAGATPGNTN